jgi:regulator of protease activity HflC (stomatin/prohibitin superfamily)
MLRRIHIASHERGFLHHGSEYVRYLSPGVTWAWGWNRSVRVVDTREVELLSPEHPQHENLEIYLRDPRCWEDLVVVDVAEDQRAIVLVDGRVHAVLGPGRRAYWKALRRVEAQVYQADELRLKHRLLDAVLTADGGRQLQEVSVPSGHCGLLYVDESLREVLAPGRYAFWRGVARIRCAVTDLREVSLAVSGQEILTADKVSLRVNLVAGFRVVDARLAAESCDSVHGALYNELQLALREAVGGRKLDELLTAKDEVGAEVKAAVAPRAELMGAKLGSVGLKDVILPGDMKVLLNQVIEAEKRAQANLIARREETAATRSLLNTAKLIESSPTLLRLKELEAAERMASSIGSIQIASGGLDGLIRQLLPKETA